MTMFQSSGDHPDTETLLRRVTEIIAPSGQVTAGVIESSPIFALQRNELEATGGYPTRLAKFRSAGFDPVSVLSGTP